MLRSQKSVTKDPETGREVWQLTNSRMHSIHPYYDTCAWNPSGTKIAFSAIDPDKISPKKTVTTPNGHLFVMDVDQDNAECITSNTDFSIHTGCFPIWVNDNTISYHAKGHTCIIDIETKEVIEIKGLRGRALSPDGSRLACGYAKDSEKKGVVVVNLNDLSQKEIVNGERLKEVMLDTFNRDERMPDFDQNRSLQIANTKWSPDGSHLMLRFNFEPEEYMKSVFVFRDDGSELKRLNLITPYFGHHSWHPDGEHILYCDLNEMGDGRLYYLTDKEGLTRRNLSSIPLGAHPIFNPAGTEIVDFADNSIIHYDIQSGKAEKLASYSNNTHSGLHPHPSWSPDGANVIYHSDHTGTSQVYAIPLQKEKSL